MFNTHICIVSVCLLLVYVCCTVSQKRTFGIDYEHDTFVMDGRPFRYVSGSVHYFRAPHQYWRDRLRKVRAAGLNAVSTYVEWSQHEQVPGQYNFTGDLNITDFIKIAQEEDLFVILRPGPYICAERDMGGLPYWLLKKYPDMYLRSSDPRYLKYADRWMNLLLDKIVPLLYGNGGPIILVQVENEYGSYVSCDSTYTEHLRDLFSAKVQDKAVLFTTDGGATSFLKCGKIKNVYATVDFGPGTDIANAFGAQRAYEPRGPLVNSEFYPGWLTHWGESMAYVSTDIIIKSLTEMLDAGANVNFYMFFGGTNFGFTAGANFGSNYVSDITSYDYDAPMTEAGDLTDKYYAIKAVVEKYLPPANITVANSQKVFYGPIVLRATASLFLPKLRQELGRSSISQYPRTFESLGQNYGYLLYETQLPSAEDEELVVTGLHDYANLYLNQNHAGNFSREFNTSSGRIRSQDGDVLGVFVENLGRINYGAKNNDTKGITGNVSLSGRIVENWNMTSFEFSDLQPVENCYHGGNDVSDQCFDAQNVNTNGFVFYVTELEIFQAGDTFMDVSNLTKGFVFVNKCNLGRYWSNRGPQKTLYVPAVCLKATPLKNIIIVMDESIKSPSITVTLQQNPIFSGKAKPHYFG